MQEDYTRWSCFSFSPTITRAHWTFSSLLVVYTFQAKITKLKDCLFWRVGQFYNWINLLYTNFNLWRLQEYINNALHIIILKFSWNEKQHGLWGCPRIWSLRPLTVSQCRHKCFCSVYLLPARNRTNGHFFMATNEFFSVRQVQTAKDMLSPNSSHFLTGRLWQIIN